MNKSAYFITLEGIEGVGKSTAAGYLHRYLTEQAVPLILTREPGGSEIAEEIRQVLLRTHTESLCLDAELLLLFASRAQHIDKVIAPALAAGTSVLCDRFTDATYGYQGGGRGIPFERIVVLEHLVQGTLRPDLTLLLDAPVAVGMARMQQRGTKDRIEQEQQDFFERVRCAYLRRARQEPWRFVIINADQPLPLVEAELRRALADYCGKAL